jgi:hypothetical protein
MPTPNEIADPLGGMSQNQAGGVPGVLTGADRGGVASTNPRGGYVSPEKLKSNLARPAYRSK